MLDGKQFFIYDTSSDKLTCAWYPTTLISHFASYEQYVCYMLDWLTLQDLKRMTNKTFNLSFQIQFNLADFTRRAYGTNYVETLRVQIHANCRIRRVYFSDRLYSEEELPAEFKLYLPVQNQSKQQQLQQQVLLWFT